MTKILVIEDEAPLREEILEWLSYEGYETVGAADGVEGVNVAVCDTPDLIICDISMPRLDGYGVLLDIQANSTIQSTPFIFLSARADRDDVRKGMLLGADDYITKPFSKADLLEAVQSRLGKKAVLDAQRDQEIGLFKAALDRERQESLFREKLSAMFAHDFRNQVTVIMTSVALLRAYADRLTEERRLGRLIAIEISSRQLLEMLDEMLALAQMDAGKNQLRLEPLDLPRFFEDLIREFQITLNGTHEISFGTDFSEAVSTDVCCLRQIAANLISNAIKYSQPQSEIQVNLEKHDTYFTVAVKDQGIGIPDADKDRILNAFQRGSNVGKIPGTGLGLAIVNQALELLGGSIEIESQAGMGTTITVSLPIVPATY